ncbi:glycosyltransferase family 4 protein [Paenibacillus lemnae]|nr:glycosyltransferase family 4 protein [Paenibacillus lemnae]
MVKVLLVTYFQIPFVGGLWRYMQQVKYGLEQAGHEVDIIGDGLDAFHQIGQDDRIAKTHFKKLLDLKLNARSAPGLVGNDWVKYAEWERYCLELTLASHHLEQYDVIHAQDVLAAAAVRRVKPAHIPLITSIHASAALTVLDTLRHNPSYPIPLQSPVWKYYRAMERIGGSVSDKVLLASHWLKGIMTEQFQLQAHQIRLIPYAMNIQEFEENMKKSGGLIPNKQSRKVIISTSRLSPEKGMDVLLKALGRLQQERQDWECWIVGDGDKKAEYIRQCRKLGLRGNVRFLGTRNDVAYLLAQADIFVMPSLMETLSYSVMEAQTAGLAIASSSAGGLSEAIRHQRDGLLSPPGSDEALCQNLNLLLRDDRLREKLGRRAKKFALKNRSLDGMMAALIQVYTKAISQKQHGTAGSETPRKQKSVRGLRISADHYNSLFVKPLFHPDQHVNREVWDRAVLKLPPGYKLPDMRVIQEMRRD